uniref:Uncharacterized protein n=1 Tax=Paraburkholderia sprentiae WSM5005 TaxID=754502 RepID=A0A1I9YH10_9BURK
MAQISLSFSGDFCPVSLSLFHGTRGAPLLIVASMTILLSNEGRVSLRQSPMGATRPQAAVRWLGERRTLFGVEVSFA